MNQIFLELLVTLLTSKKVLLEIYTLFDWRPQALHLDGKGKRPLKLMSVATGLKRVYFSDDGTLCSVQNNKIF